MIRICRFTTLAMQDLEAIMDYIAEHSSYEVAEAFLKRANKKCNQLTNFPSLGRKRDELSLGVRSVPLDDYLIFYRVLEENIEILRIVSGYRDLDTLFLQD
jgi:toxin ParE1/3/4